MTQEGFWRGVLIVVLTLALATPARADGLQTAEDEIVIGIVVVTAAIVVLTTVLILHYKSKKTAITGCVISGDNGMTVTDEKDRRTYALSGNTTGIKPGDRMRLQGKAVKPKSPEKTLVWEAKEVTKDFGVCPP